MTSANYIEKNRQLWNTRTAVHLTSAFYEQAGFLSGKTTLKEIELKLLGDIKGKSVLHLQCHFGQDSISLARMGARVVGVDLSDKSIETAKKLAEQTASDAQFKCANIYDLNKYPAQLFDIVFTSYGTIAWLPDLEPWASIISQYLKPGGKFIIAEFHPVVWMFDNEFSEITYRYFNGEPIEETENGTYADTSADIITEAITWNHGLSEVISALMKNDLVIDSFDEYDYSPYNCMRHMEEAEPGKFRISKFGDKIPLVYSVSAIKKAGTNNNV